MTIKCTLLIQHTTGGKAGEGGARVGGWSESYYADTTEFTVALVRTNALCSLRAALLPQGSVVVGQRYQQVNPVGTSRTGSATFAGNGGVPQDIPQMALYCRARTQNTANVRELVIRGLPDERVVNGNYDPERTYTAALNQFFTFLRTGWVMRGLDLSQQRTAIVSIVAPGTITTTVPHGLSVGQQFKILRTTQSNGRQAGGVYTVLTTATNKTLTADIDLALPAKGGSVRAYAIVYPPIGDCEIDRVGIRKVGRNFFQYRGRAVRRS